MYCGSWRQEQASDFFLIPYSISDPYANIISGEPSALLSVRKLECLRTLLCSSLKVPAATVQFLEPQGESHGSRETTPASYPPTATWP